ncbi:SagB/ThcOx family dehydrogenase [Bradyrhizobium tunisiense]|uniref:SagB/ThcOx family dehydrogenase n=1 Tax=Bradyrhizobium tunisiense TaxID=3278709 RepID=UPI0035D79F1B
MTVTELPRNLISGLAEDTQLWELYHENSKAGQYSFYLPPDVINQQMERMLESFEYDHYPEIPLPRSDTPLELNLASTIASRVSARGLSPCRLTLEQVAALLRASYGITRDNRGTEFPRPFRTVPSGGALYPLELYFHSARVENLEAGLYHYNPVRDSLRFLRYGDDSRRLSESLVQRNLALDGSLLLFITGVFERSTFKYGERGYRFVLLEAGHVGQNLALAATAMGLGCLTIGGYVDRQIDDLLGLDGVSQSTVYMAAIGGNAPESDGANLPTGA